MDDVLTEVTETAPAVQSSENGDADESNPMRLARRTLFGAGAAGLMGLALTKLSEQPAYAGTTITRNNIAVLPQPASTLIAKQFMSYPLVQKFIDFFHARGMDSLAERAIVTVYEDPGGAGAPPSGPAILLILPSFQPFDSTATSHETASIVAVMSCDVVGGVLAGHVVVNHNPFQIQQFSVVEYEPATGNLVPKSVTRDQIKGLTAQKIADMLGKPALDPTSKTLPSITKANMNTLAGGAFIELLNDAWSAPLYPAGAITNLTLDKSLVVKWSEVQRLRYGAVFSAISVCSSSSCAGCTSSSSSVTINL